MKPLKEFRGVYMRNTLLYHINDHEASIVNLDSESGDGTHWTLIYNDPKNTKDAYYFDSYGVAPPTEVEKYLRTSGKKIQYNTSQLQNIVSSMCGYFCVFVARELSKGRTFYECIYHLNQIDPSKNDMFLQHYFKI